MNEKPTDEDRRIADGVAANMALSGTTLTSEARERLLSHVVARRLKHEEVLARLGSGEQHVDVDRLAAQNGFDVGAYVVARPLEAETNNDEVPDAPE